MDGQWAIEDGLFVVTNGAITEKGCDGPAHAQDDWYFGFLQSQPAITADGDDLVLEGDGIRIEYLDQEIATPDRPLAGPTWSVEGIGDGVGVLFAEWPQPGTLVLADDGTVQVSTSCNGGQGSYVVVDDTVEFSDVSVTEAGCPDEFSQRMEEGMLALLYGAQPVTWEITVDRLSLRGDEASLELVAP
jgi:heat shock protein HslJ